MDKSNQIATQSIQMIPIKEQKSWYDSFVKFTKEILHEDLDFGKIPGVNKPSLLKPGAEKLRFVYGLSVETDMTDKVIDTQHNFISFTYKTTVKSKDGLILAQCEGNCNSYETKYRYIWLKEDQLPAGTDKSSLVKKGSTISEFAFAINRAETTGPYGKPAEYWQRFKDAINSGKAKRTTKNTKKGDMEAWEISDFVYRMPNTDPFNQLNTIMKMAQKRSFVGAILIATGASEFFTQDVEDLQEFGVIDDEEKNKVNVDKPTKTNLEEGEVIVDNPVEKVTVEPQLGEQQIHLNRITNIKKLIGEGKIKWDQSRDIDHITSQESKQIMDGYLKFIGK